MINIGKPIVTKNDGLGVLLLIEILIKQHKNGLTTQNQFLVVGST